MTYTLVSDGSSDRALLPILTWSLRQQGFTNPISPQWADLRNLRDPPSELRRRIEASVELYPCDLLFIHRDAENRPSTERATEIAEATEQLDVPFVGIVPVRMMEAWLLTDEAAIRIAAGNPNGTNYLNLPPVQNLEDLPDPKATLHELLLDASGLTGRRRQRLNVGRILHRITELTDDFSLLGALPAFVRFSGQLRQTLIENEFIVS